MNPTLFGVGFFLHKILCTYQKMFYPRKFPFEIFKI